MAVAYTEFDTTPATIVADIKAKILLSSNWSNIAGNIVKAVDTNGAQMVVDLTGVAATNLVMTLRAWRLHDGVTGTDSTDRWLHWHRTAGVGAATDVVHVVVSAGPDHLYISAEGPRGGETNADHATFGSQRSTFFLGSIVPYFSAGLDPVPSVCLVGCQTISTATQSPNQFVAVSRNAANTLSWVVAILETVAQLGGVANSDSDQGNFTGLDGNICLRPWVVKEVTAGDRGRLKACHYAGQQTNRLHTVTSPVLGIGQKVSYSGLTYTVHHTGRAVISNHYYAHGWMNNIYYGNPDWAPLIAIPSA